MKLIRDAFLVTVQKEIRDCPSMEEDDGLVLPVHDSLEEFLAAQIMTRPTRCLEQPLFDDRLR
jgi:hypothetical protein